MKEGMKMGCRGNAVTQRKGRKARAPESNAGLDYIQNEVQAKNLSVPSLPWECRWDYMVERPEKGGADSTSAAEAARAAGAKLGLGNLVPGVFYALRGRENAEGTTCVPGSSPGVSTHGDVAQMVERCFLCGNPGPVVSRPLSSWNCRRTPGWKDVRLGLEG